MAKTYLMLQQSEGFVIQAAAQIYAAHITAGIQQGEEEACMKKSIQDAIRIAQAVDEAIVADNEVG